VTSSRTPLGARRGSWPLADRVAMLARLADGAVLVDLAPEEADVVLAGHEGRAVEVVAAREGAHAAAAVRPLGAAVAVHAVEVVDAVGAQNPIVDYDHNGLLDLADIITFVDLFTAGCPD